MAILQESGDGFWSPPKSKVSMGSPVVTMGFKTSLVWLGNLEKSLNSLNWFENHQPGPPMIWKSSARSPYDLKIISQVPLWFENHQPGPPMIWKSSARSPYDLKIISQVPLWFENHQPGPPMIWKSSARSPYDLKIISQVPLWLKIISQVPLWFENHQPGPPIIKMIRKPKKNHRHRRPLKNNPAARAPNHGRTVGIDADHAAAVRRKFAQGATP